MNTYSPDTTNESNEITNQDFAALARRRNWSVEFLAHTFRRKIETPNEFFHGVVSGKRPEVVIPFGSVIDFYRQYIDTQLLDGQRACACGCGQPIFSRQKWASPRCKKRIARQRVADTKKGGSQLPDFVEPKPGQISGVAAKVFTRSQTGTNGRQQRYANGGASGGSVQGNDQRRSQTEQSKWTRTTLNHRQKLR